MYVFIGHRVKVHRNTISRMLKLYDSHMMRSPTIDVTIKGSVNPYDVTWALSVRKIYALAILMGCKIVENRSILYKIEPGWFAVHTTHQLAQKHEIEHVLRILNTTSSKHQTWYDIMKKFTTKNGIGSGMIVGMIRIDCVKTKNDCIKCPWTTTGLHWCYVIGARVKLDKPVLCPGSQRFWKIDDLARQQIQNQKHKKPQKNNLSTVS